MIVIGLMYKDFKVMIDRFKPANIIAILVVSLFFILLMRGSGATFIAIILPLVVASTPVILQTSDEKSGWDKYVWAAPISKKGIIWSRYLFCLGLIAGTGLFTIIVNILTQIVFQDLPLKLHLIISIVGLLISVLYLLLLLPAVYAYGTSGNTIVSFILIAAVMFFLYAINITNLGDKFIRFVKYLLNIDIKIVCLAIGFMYMVILLFSFQLSLMVYTKKFKR